MKPGVELRGTAAFSFRTAHGSIIKLRAGDSSKCLIDMTYAYGAKLSSLCLSGRGADDPQPVAGVFVDKPDYGTQEDTPCLDNCRIESFSSDCIHFERIWCFSIRHCHMMHNGGSAIRVRGWDGFILDNWLSGSRGAGYLAVDENASVTMTGNRIEWNRGGGIVIRGGTCYNITGNYIDRSGRFGIELERTSSAAVTGNIIYRSGKAEWTEPGESAQVRIADSSGVAFTGNVMRAGGDDGGRGVFSPENGLVLSRLCDCVVRGNTLSSGALAELVKDSGGHTGTIVAENAGSLVKPQGKI